MKIKMIMALCASVAPIAFMSDMVETVLVKGAGGKPLRVNKSDFDADQASEKPTMTLHKDDDGPAVADGEAPVKTFGELGMQPVAAPSAPDFSGGDGAAPLPIDPDKNAAAPVAPSPNQRLVSKEGTGARAKYFVVDGTGTKLTDGVDADGYKTEQEAWAAIMALPH